jgi:hypothetical protein
MFLLGGRDWQLPIADCVYSGDGGLLVASARTPIADLQIAN